MTRARSIACTLAMLSLAAFVASCDDSAAPTAPSAATAKTASGIGIGDVTPSLKGGTIGVANQAVGGESLIDVSVDGLLSAPDGSTLKSNAPTPVSPIDDQETEDLTPLLVTGNARAAFITTAEFDVSNVRMLFELSLVRPDGSTVVVDANQTAQTNPTTSYRVNLELDQTTTYQWRVRAQIGEERGPWSNTATFHTPTLVSIDRPTPIAPPDGSTTDTFTPVLIVTNGLVTGPVGAVVVEYELGDEGPTFPNPVMFSAGLSPSGTTSAGFEDPLAPGTQFWWRVRATNGTITTDWTDPFSFFTPSVTSGPRTPDPPLGGALPLPDQIGLVFQYAADHPAELGDSCIDDGGSWAYMDGLIDALRATDTRWGFNCKRGDCNTISEDIANYFYGAGDGIGSTEVYLIDVISAVCPGGNQSASWQDQTDVTAQAGAVGRFIWPRP